MGMLIRRLYWAWQLKMLPWKVPASVVKWVAINQRPTQKDIRRTRELANKYGWEK